MAKKQGKSGESKPQDDYRGPVRSFRPDAEVNALLDKLSSRERRSIAQIMQMLIEEALAARGLMESRVQTEEDE